MKILPKKNRGKIAKNLNKIQFLGIANKVNVKVSKIKSANKNRLKMLNPNDDIPHLSKLNHPQKCNYLSRYELKWIDKNDMRVSSHGFGKRSGSFGTYQLNPPTSLKTVTNFYTKYGKRDHPENRSLNFEGNFTTLS